MEQEKEANPIAEIFDEVFTLMEDLETRSVALLKYMQEQGGVTDEKLAPYLDRAAAASNVRWRAARARMEHLLAPKPKSTTDTGKDEKTKDGAQPQAKEKDAESGGAKAQGQNEKDQKSKPESIDLGKELASAQPGAEKSGEGKDDRAKAENTANTANTATDAKPKEKGQGDRKQDQGKESEAASGDAEAQASALGSEKKSDTEKSNTSKKSTTQSEDGNSNNWAADTGKPQTQKAAK
jgi:hypothetical protein